MAKTFVPRPEYVVVGHMTYTIEYLTPEEWDGRRHPDDAAGVCEADKASIQLVLTDDLAEAKLRERLLHEITHAVWATTTMSHLIVMDGGLPDDLEETLVLAMSPMMLMVLRDNPHVIKYLVATDR